jgi:hypothetical protein
MIRFTSIRHSTNFYKFSKGGMMGSKQYFWNIPKNVTSALDLVEYRIKNSLLVIAEY